jgi:beta-lactam-binding protein with PASTA domain
VLLAGALLAGMLAATIGAGYSISRPLLDNPGAYVAKNNSVVYLNPESGKVEAEARALANGKDPMEIVTLADGRVAVVDKKANKVWIYDPGPMKPVGPPIDHPDPPQPPSRPGGGGTVVVPAPDSGYLGSGDVVSEIDRDGRPGTPVKLPARMTDELVPDASEGIWVLTDDGHVVHVVKDKVRHNVSIDRPFIHLTIADGHPIGLTDAGDLIDVSAQSLHRVTTERLPHGNALVVGSPKGAGRWVLILDRDNGQLSAVDIRTGMLRTANDIPHGTGHNLGAPVQLDDRVYIPDYGNHRLYVRDIGTGRSIQDVVVPGESETFSLDVKAGRVWVNDQFDRRPVVIGRDGSTSLPDKGPAPDQTDTTKPPSDPGKDEKPQEPTPPPSAPPSTPAPPAAETAPPVEVPQIAPGTPIDRACQQIKDAGLKCVPAAAGDGGPTNTVVTDDPTDPPARTRVPKSSRVVVRHYGPTGVPVVVGQYSENACAILTAATLKCVKQPRADAAPDPKDLDVVKEQSPAANSKTPTGANITISYHDKAVVADYRNQPGAAACTAFKQTYRNVECQVVEGSSQQQTGKPAGYVYDHSPAPGAVVQLAGSVTMVVVKGSPPVPGVVNQSPEAACATVRSAGYVCDPRPDRLARHRVVTDQEPPAGTPMDPGGTVIVHYAPNEPVQLAMYRRSDNPDDNQDYVFLIGLAAGPPPHPDYTLRKQIIGWGYVAGAAGPGLAPLTDHFCTANVRVCLGYPRNHYFSRGAAQFHPGWVQQSAPSVLTSCGAGTIPIWRVWKIDKVDGITRHKYNVRNDDGSPIGFPGNEALGCLWAS